MNPRFVDCTGAAATTRSVLGAAAGSDQRGRKVLQPPFLRPCIFAWIQQCAVPTRQIMLTCTLNVDLLPSTSSVPKVRTGLFVRVLNRVRLFVLFFVVVRSGVSRLETHSSMITVPISIMRPNGHINSADPRIVAFRP